MEFEAHIGELFGGFAVLMRRVFLAIPLRVDHEGRYHTFSLGPVVLGVPLCSSPGKDYRATTANLCEADFCDPCGC